MPKRQKLNPKDKGVKIMDEVYMLIMDGTSYGEYENSATALLFKTYEEAEQFVEDSFRDNVINKSFVGEDYTADQLAAKIEETCKWYGETEAQYRDGDTIADYKIEKVKIPS